MNTFRMSRQLWALSAYLICTSAHSYICQMRTHALLDSAKCMEMVLVPYIMCIFMQNHMRTHPAVAQGSTNIYSLVGRQTNIVSCANFWQYFAARNSWWTIYIHSFAFSTAPHQYHNATVRYVCAYVTECF